MSAGPVPGRTVFAADSEGAREFIRRTYGARLLPGGIGPGGIYLTVDHADAGPFAVTDLTQGADLAFAVEGTAAIMVATLDAGTYEVEQRDGLDRFGPGDLLMASRPGLHYRYRARDLRSRLFVLPLPLFHEFPGIRRDRPGASRFLSQHPAGNSAVAVLQHIMSYASDLLATPQMARSSLLVAAAGRMLAAATVAAFASTVVSDPTAQDRRDAHSATLRRAVAFVDHNARTDITLTDIAAAASVSTRAVQLAFRRHLATTPMDYLRRVRLDHAHRDLLAADPAGETVTAVAYRWGFTSASQFIACYRQAYGVLPSDTLHRG